MQYRKLGASGIEASVIGLGAWAIGGWMWGGTDKEQSIKAIHAALDSGINLVDTAPVYGFGVSEDIVGEAIKDRRDKVILATKCGMVPDTQKGESKFRVDAMGPNPNGAIDVRIFLGPDSIKQEIELSLKRLKTDYIDLYQTHWQEDTTKIEDTMAMLEQLKKEGKIRAIGCSNATPKHMKQYSAAGQLDSDQEKYSMLDKRNQRNLDYAKQNNLAVLAYSPIEQGLLTGKMGPDRKFPERDLRNGKERYNIEHRQRVTAMLDKFKHIAEEHNITQTQLTLAWTVSQPGLTHALSGVRTTQQAQENAAAGAVKLTEQELETINNAIAEYGPQTK